MGDDLRNARLQREVVAAELYAAEHATDVLEMCANVGGDDSTLTTVLMAAFDFTEVQAEAVQSMQVRRFTPLGIERLRSRLAELDDLLRPSS
jgi:DNA gyrase/topoisomerase IV subunit A